MQSMLNIAIQAATKAGKLMMRYYDRIDTITVTTKGHRDLVTEVDLMVEQEISAHLHKAFPKHGILCEEGTSHAGDDYQWIIDPIDGTMNFVHGFPQFSVSIALQHKQETVAGLVYDPIRHEMFTALRGSGARLNNRRIRVSKAKHLKDGLIGTGFPIRAPEKLPSYLAGFNRVIEQCSGIRRAGSAAMDLAYVAAGRLDGYWETNLSIWDIAAGVLLVKEAGGLITDFQGQEQYHRNGDVICGNPAVYKSLFATVSTPEAPASL